MIYGPYELDFIGDNGKNWKASVNFSSNFVHLLSAPGVIWFLEAGFPCTHTIRLTQSPLHSLLLYPWLMNQRPKLKRHNLSYRERQSPRQLFLKISYQLQQQKHKHLHSLLVLFRLGGWKETKSQQFHLFWFLMILPPPSQPTQRHLQPSNVQTARPRCVGLRLQGS